MAGYIRLQSLTQVQADSTQRLDAAVDLGDFGLVTLQLRVAKAGSVGSLLHLQHAAVLEEDAFTDCAAVPLDIAGSHVVVLPAPLRYLRWRAVLTDVAATFLVDLIGRDGSPPARSRPLQVIKDVQDVTNAAGDTTLTWNEGASEAIAGDGLSWNDTDQAIAVARTGLLTLHFNLAAWNVTSWPALVNVNTWVEEHNGATWSILDGSRSNLAGTGGTHTVTIQRVVPSANRQYRVRAANQTVSGGTWRFDNGTFWARWVE